jgi:hypothetical protein
MSRGFGIWVSVALFVAVALAAIPTFVTFHGSKSTPKSSQAIPLALPLPDVPYPRPECSRNELLDSSLALRSRCERERLLHPSHARPLLVTSH